MPTTDLTPDPAREAAILARCEAATPGPWGTDLYYVTGMVPGARPGGEVLVQCRPTVTGLRGYQQPLQEANAAFIAHAREDVPWLLAQLAAARARAERAEGALERIRDGAGSNTIALSDVQDERAHTWGGVYRIATSVVGERVIHADTDIARALAARGE